MSVATLLVLALVQAVPDADAQMVSAARTASAAFDDRAAAVRAGYRRLGPETPEMGEHWINPIMIVESRYDATRPPVLTYATIAGRPVLTGVAYALTIPAGADPPSTGVSGDWHDHTGTVADELSGATRRGATGARVVLLHAWVWTENPNGPFADANWRLPYLRAGLEPPDRIDPHASRAVSLLFDGGAYYVSLLRGIGGVDTTALGECAHAVRALLGSSAVQSMIVSNETDARLAALWRRAVDRVVDANDARHEYAIRLALVGAHH